VKSNELFIHHVIMTAHTSNQLLSGTVDLPQT